jgi:hypothetical protein
VILAETGDLTRFASAHSVVKHAGLNPAENTSATFRLCWPFTFRLRVRVPGVPGGWFGGGRVFRR